MKLVFATAMAVALAAPLAAQTGTSPADQPSTPLPYDPGHDSNTPRSNAIAAKTAPGVAAANGQVQAQADAQLATSVGVDNAQYTADMAAYRDALRARHHAVNRDQAVYDHQQRAYADAMAQWRFQVAACKRGHNRACNLPTPDPAAYW